MIKRALAPNVWPPIAIIPDWLNRKRTIHYDKDRYREPHQMENALCRLQDFRRVVIRYGKLVALPGGGIATALAFWL